jgi:hypothetical protein
VLEVWRTTWTGASVSVSPDVSVPPVLAPYPSSLIPACYTVPFKLYVLRESVSAPEYRKHILVRTSPLRSFNDTNRIENYFDKSVVPDGMYLSNYLPVTGRYTYKPICSPLIGNDASSNSSITACILYHENVFTVFCPSTASMDTFNRAVAYQRR